ncbi:RNA-binding protein [Paramyrothecium foliicola]|nr:RNA-binding protein [Paramyrothecium foliicola]
MTAMMANPVGEDSWLAYLEETSRTASDLEQRVNVVEVYKRAVSAEPGSLRIWLSYCNYFWSLWADSQSPESAWPDEERIMGRELFSFGTALDLWQQGYEAIKYRLDDSHLLWDRWISLEMELLGKSGTPEGVKRISHLYRDRLQTPHATWDDTSQAFSSFLSEHNRTVWEESMKEATARAQDTKRLIAAREPFEFKLSKAVRTGDLEAQKSIMTEYLEWEMLQSKRNNDNPDIGLDLCRGLFARALTGVFATDEDTWYSYIVFLSSSHSDLQLPENLLDVLRRAVRHCPWSGRLWNRYILCAEEGKLAFGEIESIKHAATSEDQLYKNGMENMIEMYVAWCGFLKRTAMDATATDEAVDLADVGLGAALEDVNVVGQRLYGKDFQGDPKFRLERIYIQYLTEKKGAIDEARAQWNKLAAVQIHADSHDFWFRYYMWEMLIFSSNPPNNRSPTPSSNGAGFRIPSLATAVLARAAARRTLDWPEKVLEVYQQHCNDYELPAIVRRATDVVHKAERGILRRREREQQEKAATYAAYYEAQATEAAKAASEPNVESPAGAKRKREDVTDAESKTESAAKRQKGDQEIVDTQQQPQRDRENATIIVKDLPYDVTQTKLRQYFREFGHVNSITALVREDNGQSSTALIEFSSTEEARSALLRDQKYFGQAQISVQPGYDLTVYVANFPPSADDVYIRRLFNDCGSILSIRWPSLKVNSHRRFCYVSFRDREASARAVQKDGELLEGQYKLLAKYSNPTQKKNREGAVAEGREIHVSNLSRSVTEDELRAIFSKAGTIVRINVPRSLAGKGRGIAYVEFDKKEAAEKAVADYNNANVRGQVVRVEVSKESKVKPAAKSSIATEVSTSSQSPRDAEGDEAMKEANDDMQPKASASNIASRTIALMGLPDTVNDTRVRALVEPLGPIVKLVLLPSHGGAKIEFADAATAGKASLKLNSVEFEGRTLRTGSLDQLRHEKAYHADDRIAPVVQQTQKKTAKSTNNLMLPPTTSIRRPVLSKPGPKRGLGFGPRKSTAVTQSDEGKPAANGLPAPKSNADFKAMFLSSGGNKTDVENENHNETESKTKSKTECQTTENGV